ncbi:MAG: ATP-binding protein [Bacteriovoracaceae bacterium]
MSTLKSYIPFRNFLREIYYCSCLNFDDRKTLLKPALTFIAVFFTAYFAFSIIPKYGINSVEFSYEFSAGLLISTFFVISYFLTKKFTANPLLFLPSFGAFLASMLLLSAPDFYQKNNFLWIHVQFLSILIACFFNSVRCNSVLAVLNIFTPLILAHNLDHLDFSGILEMHHIVVFSSVIAIVFSYQNILNKKSSLQSLLEANFIKETSKLGLWKWNLLTNEVVYDERWCEILGYKQTEIEQSFSTFQKLCSPDDIDRVSAAVQELISGNLPNYEIKFKMKHKDGHGVDIISHGRIVERDSSGNPKAIHGTHLDISEIVELNFENQKLNELTDAMQDIAKVGAWELDIKTMKVKWTEEIYKIYEIPTSVPTDKVLGMSYYDEDEKPILEGLLSDCITKGIPFDREFNFTSEKGNKKIVRSMGKPVYDENNNCILLRGVFQDVSQRVKIEKELEQERLKIIQSSKLATLGEMAAGIAHEINNPLAIIQGSASLLTRHKDNPTKVLETSDKLKKSVKRIGKIVNGLRKFSRNSSLDEVLQQDHSVTSLVSEVLELVEAKSKRHGVPVEFHTKDDLIIRGDDIQIQQVLVNLINNAIDANTGAQSPWVKIHVKKNNQSTQILVSDSGHGIENHIIEKLFDPFYTTKEVGKGTGLGLSISKTILNAHNGDLEYKKINGHTTFILTLPQKDLSYAA